MEFVSEREVMGLLRDFGISAQSAGDDQIFLELADTEGVVRLQLATPEDTPAADDAAQVIKVERDRLAEAVDGIIHKLHLRQVLLIPVGKWRNIFDAVAFSLADNEDWQEFDTTATVELNTRDPLLCEPGDFQTVSALLRALLSDAENAVQGLMLTTTAAPLLVEIVPGRVVRVSFGNQVMADEVAEAFQS